jgi:hypothetical protein
MLNMDIVWLCFINRAINYDEKDPFLCHACGFCKYAKFDYTLTGRACCAVDPIESDDDRKKTVATINSLLEKADRVYKQLIANKPTLEVSDLQHLSAVGLHHPAIVVMHKQLAVFHSKEINSLEV